MRAAIFDIDGTLLDSVDLHAKAWQEALRKFGHDVPFDTVRHQIGKGGDQLIPVFLTRSEQQQYGQDLEKYRGRIWKEKYLAQVRPFPCVRELFLKPKQDNLRLVLASSAKKDELEQYERIAGIQDLVDHKASSDDAEKSKPHPDIFQAALKRLGDVSASEAVVVGDSPYDAEAAGKLGLLALGVRSGGFSDRELTDAGFRTLYNDCCDVLRQYETSAFSQKLAA